MKWFLRTIPVVSILLACVVVLWPLGRSGFYFSDDGEWMVIRLSAFYQSLADGQFPVRFLGRLNNSNGYPVANFLYPGFLYLGSIVHFFGFSFVASIKLILVGAVAGSAIWIFVTLRRVFSSFAAVLGVFAFVGSPYLLYDLYTRGSVGEILAFLPASIGIYSIVENKRWLFPIAVFGLIVSHNTLAVLFSFILLVFIFTQKRKHFLWSFMIGIGMAAFFWIPAIAEKQYVRFDIVMVSNPMEYVLGIDSLWMMGVAGMVAGVIVFLGKVTKLGRLTRMALALYIISILLTLPISGFIWSVRPVASLVQFPYRMLAVGTLLSPWIVAAAAERLVRQKVLTGAILLFILAMPVWYQTQKVSTVVRDEGYYTTNEATTTVKDEFMPRWVRDIPKSRSSERLIIASGGGTVVYEYLNTQRIVAQIESFEESVLRLNTIYYPGWGIMIDNKPTKINYQNPNGYMEVSISKGKHRFVAEFRETIPRFLADLISLGSLIAWVAFLLKGIKRQ